MDNNLNIIIRETVPDDTSDLINLLHQAWLKAYPNPQFGITPEGIEHTFTEFLTPEGQQKYRERLSYLKEGERKFTALINGVIVGTCGVVKGGEYNQLKMMYISPDWQGKGIGHLLWQEACQFLDPEKKTIVHVVSYADQALNFYRKLGFQDTGKNFFDERYDMQNGVRLPETELVLPPNSF